MIEKLKRKFFNWFYLKFPPEMVQYWKRTQAIKAKVTKAPDGHYIMWMKGEKYPFPGFPRGWLLFGSLSKVKHIIKNFIFNDSWALLEEGTPEQKVINRVKDEGMKKMIELADLAKYDMLPYEKMAPAVKEIWRAFTAVEKKVGPETAKKVKAIKDCLTYVIQEDDGYRFRVQWLTNYFPQKKWFRKIYLSAFQKALEMMEHAEVVGDMKERIRLLRRILLVLLKDKRIYELFEMFCEEMDWKKIKLSKADKYYFRAKYFKADFDKWDY